MRNHQRKNYEKRVRHALRKNEHRDFLAEQLRKEWDALEKSIRRDRLISYAKTTGAVVTKSILALLLIGGVVSVMAVAPNMFAAIDRLSGRKRFFHKREFGRAAAYLKSKKYAIVYRNDESGYRLRITDAGADVILSKAMKDVRIPISPSWDGIWRIVIFDIPNRHKWSRDTLRQQLKIMGFYQAQESVFVCPYPCDEELRFVISLLNVNDYIRVIETNTIFPDEDMRRHFSLASPA